MAIKAMAILTLVLGRGPMDMAVVTVELPLCRNWISLIILFNRFWMPHRSGSDI